LGRDCDFGAGFLRLGLTVSRKERLRAIGHRFRSRHSMFFEAKEVLERTPQLHASNHN
jgi:hypothetical protein